MSYFTSSRPNYSDFRVAAVVLKLNLSRVLLKCSAYLSFSVPGILVTLACRHYGNELSYSGMHKL